MLDTVLGFRIRVQAGSLAVPQLFVLHMTRLQRACQLRHYWCLLVVALDFQRCQWG
jgi:hypothetical protein